MPNLVLRDDATTYGTYNPVLRRLKSLTGITRDSAGNVLGNSVVHLFRTVSDLETDQGTSDAITGSYAFSTITDNLSYYVVGVNSRGADSTNITADSTVFTADRSSLQGVTVNVLVGV